MKNQSVTIKDIAKALGVSKSTVSRALRDKHDIHPGTREKVWDMAQKMDYQPNQVALSLRKNSTKTIGVVIPGYIIPFYSLAISGIQDEAYKNGYNIITCQSNESYEMEKANIHTLLASKVDGIILSLSKETNDYQHVYRLRKKGVPFVFFNRTINNKEFCRVLVDDYQGGLEITKHLIERGYQRIAHLMGPKSLIISQNRLNGFYKAMKEAGKAVPEGYILEGDFTEDNGKKLTCRLLDLPKPPDALFCVCDAMAFGAMQEARGRGLAIPGDIAIAGFTNEPVAPLVTPPLTTIAQPAYEIGCHAARILLDQIQHKGKEICPEVKILKTKLVVREST